MGPVGKTEIVILAPNNVMTYLAGGLAEETGLAVVGKAFEPAEMKRIAAERRQAVSIIYAERADGPMIELCQSLNELKLQYVAVCPSAQLGFDMLQQGAAEMIVLHEIAGDERNRFFFPALKNKISFTAKLSAEGSTRTLKNPNLTYFRRIIAIGSSTGGTDAVFSIISKLPEDMPPILIVQHMPPVFTKMYAQRLHDGSRLSVWEAKDGDTLRQGQVLLAPGGLHMTLAARGGNNYYVECRKGEKVQGQCPSVDVLFESVAKVAPEMTLGVILTGMGADGAAGLLKMRQRGSRTLGQDRDSSVVYGMPKAAYELGAVEKQVSLEQMPAAIMEAVK